MSHSVRSVASTSATPYGTPGGSRRVRRRRDDDDGGSASGAGQVMRASDAKPQYSMYKQEVLTEDEYVEALSNIIKRDFFPALKHLDAQNEIINAYESEDPHRIEESVRRMRELVTPTPKRRNRGATPGRTPFANTPSETPAYFGQTPDSRFTSSSSKRRAVEPEPPRVDPTISLDAFQSRYTSEDNSSFAELLAKDNAARRERHAWAWNAENRARAKAIRGREARERLVDITRKMVESSGDGSVKLLEGGAGRPGETRLIVKGVDVHKGDRFMIEGRKDGQLLLTAGPERADHSVLYTDRERAKMDKGKQKAVGEEDPDKQYVDWDKPTAEEDEDNKAPHVVDMQAPVDAWSFTNRNSLMFPPDADIAHESELPGAKSTAKAREGGVTVGEPKGIRFHATRLQEVERAAVGDENESTSSPSRSRIGAAIAGTPYPAPESRTPKVHGFSFVDALPSPSAAALPAESLQELMTWGTIEATPVTLRSTGDVADSPGPFRLRDTSRREVLAHEMARKAKRSLADRADDGRGSKGLATGGLRRSVFDMSTRGSRAGTPGSTTRGGGGAGAGASPGSLTPRSSAGNLSPAASALLGRTGQGKKLASGMSNNRAYADDDERRRIERAKTKARHVEDRDRLSRQRWSMSPAVSLGFDPNEPSEQ